MSPRDERPIVALTIGDPAGIGPEVIAAAWSDAELHALCRPVAFTSPGVIERATRFIGNSAQTIEVAEVEQACPTPRAIPCLIASRAAPPDLEPGRLDPRGGRVAYDCLVAATDLALAGRVAAIVTAPLNKEALHAAGIDQPGHTEILAQRCGVERYAMMLYLGPDQRGRGVGVVHVTLHMALRDVFRHITRDAVEEKIALADAAMRRLIDDHPPRIAVAGLNPHAGEGGLFGDEEARIIGPAVEHARAKGINVSGPIPADTLFARARAGEFDAVVAMYHDQGHVAIKSLGPLRAVNVTLGLPIVRTSVAHGTAYDIAGRGIADGTNLIEAVWVAVRLARSPSPIGRPAPP